MNLEKLHLYLQVITFIAVAVCLPPNTRLLSGDDRYYGEMRFALDQKEAILSKNLLSTSVDLQAESVADHVSISLSQDFASSRHGESLILPGSVTFAMINSPDVSEAKGPSIRRIGQGPEFIPDSLVILCPVEVDRKALQLIFLALIAVLIGVSASRYCSEIGKSRTLREPIEGQAMGN